MTEPMDEAARHRYEAKSSQLRVELKQFEADWARRNGGNKPGRQDIKQNPDIASKYKKYNHVRDVLAGKLPATPPRPRKRTPEHDLSQTPSKRPKTSETPSRGRTHATAPGDSPFETPSSRTLFSPAMPTSIGPTPQKNGRVLGMFDLLDENTENVPPDEELAREKSQLQATPSKRPPSAEIDTLKLGRTPMSSSKRNMLNAFMTPRKQKEDNPLGARTPNSVSKLHLNTPAFLRRAPLPTVGENAEYVSPPAAWRRLPRKPLGRSLSSIVTSLRKLEDERLDDEMEALREMENEFDAPHDPRLAMSPSKPPPKVLEPDSQTPQLLGGFDDEALYDSPTEEAKGPDGQPLRVYKKKGQKRTTRRVNMKPTKAKRPQPTKAKGKPELGADDEDEDEDEDVVPETQFDATKPIEDLPDMGSDSDSDFHASDAEESKEPTQKAPKKATTDAKKEGKVQKAARKVNELAHANFKRLKLRNTGSKGGPGFGSRFRRRK
ncbi:DNA replication/checkpoint protein [Nemania sp. FL0916]|nr:DNA replication/checkpoint protein [Nemania sp. FL0916]